MCGYAPPYLHILACHAESMDYTLTPADIEEFRAIWREEKGEELPLERAEIIAPRFLSVIHQIVTLCDRADVKAAALDDPATQMA